MENEHPKKATQVIHMGDNREQHQGAISTPVYRASLFGFESYPDFLAAISEETTHPVYTRFTNPTRDALETKIALLEKADHAIAFSSGMGAVSAALLSFLGAGDHALIVSCCYGPTREFCDTMLTRLGVDIEYFDPAEAVDLSPRLKTNTRLIYLESPGSLTFQLQDIQAVVKVAQANNVVTVLDNSWATPIYQQPIAMGVDVVVHSGTKYIAGHSDVVVGLLACKAKHYKTIKSVAVLLGANLSPDDAYLVTRGLRTLPLRMAQHHAAGLKIARWLRSQPQVSEVLHPGLHSFPSYDLARTQMQGYSSLFAFKLHPVDEATRHAFVYALKYFSIAVSWGGFESLILPIGHIYKNAPELRQKFGIDDNTFRICIGLEDVSDLIGDLRQALEEIA